MPVRAVAFDLDYTLAVPTRGRAALLQEALEAAGGRAAADLSRGDYVDAHAAHPDSDTREPIFAALLADHDADPAAAATAYREALAETIRPVEGVEPMLADLRAEYDLALLTDGPGRAQRDKLAALGWTDTFDPAVVTGDLGTRKPDPAAFGALLDGLDAAPSEVVYVGDNVERDVYGAADAGLLTVQVLGDADDPEGRAPSAPDGRADAHVRRPDLAAALPRLLAELG